jgi:hypothetical protein
LSDKTANQDFDRLVALYRQLPAELKDDFVHALEVCNAHLLAVCGSARAANPGDWEKYKHLAVEPDLFNLEGLKCEGQVPIPLVASATGNTPAQSNQPPIKAALSRAAA